MCGIAGIANFSPRRIPDYERLRDMGNVLRHRGPDDNGIAVAGRVGLVHRRLSIIDLAGGHQPMTNTARNVWLSYNGEIYNYRELRSELRSGGCRFRTASDTEVILNAYERYGEECVQHLRGMFAFAIWDESRQKLFLARDRLGIKPLYYAVTGRELLFGSEIKALLASGLIRPELNRTILPEYLALRYVSGGETFFSGVRALPPGHTLTWTPESGCRERRYWQLPPRIDRTSLRPEEYADEVRMRLEESVQAHMVSDVPVGLFLSGGLDSSALAAIMARHSSDPVHSFGVGFSEHGYNELSYARMVAKAIGTEHRDVMATAEDFFAALPRMVWHEDEPVAFPSSVTLHIVARLAARHVKVVMTGEGADELFLGYNRYRVTAWNQRLGRPYWAAIPRGGQRRISRLVGGLPRSLRRYAERSFLGPAQGIRGLFYENFAVFHEQLQQQLLAAETLDRDPYAKVMALYEQAPGGTLERMSYADMQSYLVELLMKQDQMSMAASIESRVPMLDHRFVEYVAAIPGRYKLRGWQTKAVLRAAVRDLLPQEILSRGKMGFPVPIGGWLRGRYSSLLDDLVLSRRALARGLFDPEVLRRLVAEHRRGERNHGDRLWTLMNLELWQRVFVDGERPEAVIGQPADRGRLPAVA